MRTRRMRLAERLDGPLGLAESTWLDEHLAGCPACTRDRHGIRGRPARAALLCATSDRTAARPVGADGGGDRAPSHMRGARAALPARGAWRRCRSGPCRALTVVAGRRRASACCPASISIYPDTGNGVKGEDPAGDGPSLASATPRSAAVEPTPFAVGSVGPWVDRSGARGRPPHARPWTRSARSRRRRLPAAAREPGPCHGVQRATKTIVGSPTRRRPSRSQSPRPRATRSSSSRCRHRHR